MLLKVFLPAKLRQRLLTNNPTGAEQLRTTRWTMPLTLMNNTSTGTQ